MKKNLWIWVLAATFMTACSNDNEPTQQQTVTENDFESPDGQVVIQLGGGERSASANTTVTRVPVTDANFLGTEVGVFALATQNGTDTPATDWSSNPGALLNNIQGVISEHVGEHLGSIDGTKKISLYKGGKSGAVYYYPMDNKYDYTFYGYSPYQSTGVTTTASQVTVNFTFDGSQDIMCNKAAAPNIPEHTIYLDENSDEMNGSILTGYKAKYIRLLKYNHDILEGGKTQGSAVDYKWVPNINFEHLLTQFTFQVIAAKKQSASDKAKAQEMKVKGIKIKNHGTNATLNVITGALTFTGAESLSMLTRDSDTEATGTFTPSILENGGDTVGYLMANPTNGTTPLELEVTIEAPNKDSSVPSEQTLTLSVNTAGGFKKGIIYNIQIGVYAMQEIMADATLTAWQTFDGGNIDAPVE